MKTPRFKLLFFGSDTFSLIVLKYLLAKRLCPIQVVTRSSSLLGQFSSRDGLNLHNWPLDSTIIPHLSNIGLVASFGHLIDEATINQFKYGLFNIHPSLLPQYRGSTPVQAAIRDGISVTGCTVMRIPPIPKFDIGEIILQEKVAIQEEEYATELRDRLAHLGATMFEKLLLNYEFHISGARQQGVSNKSYAKKLKSEDGELRFKIESSDTISRKVRAYTSFTELFTYCLNGLRVRLEDMISPKEVEKYDLNKLSSDMSASGNAIDDTVHPGTIYFHKVRHLVCIKCSDHKWLAFNNVTPTNKARMSALDFYNGYLSKKHLLDRNTDI